MNVYSRGYRFVAKVLVLAIILQGVPLVQISEAYYWEPRNYVQFIDSLFRLFSPAAAHAADVTESIELIRGRLGYDRLAGTSYSDIALNNVGTDAITTPVRVVIAGTTHPSVTVANPDGQTAEGLPYFEYDTASGVLGSGETTDSKRWIFNNPNRLRFDFFLHSIDDSQSEVNTPPVADAGVDQTHTLALVQSAMSVSLDGSASADADGTISAYYWTGTPDPDDISTPLLELGEGAYTFTLVVADDDGANSEADSVTVTILPAPNQPPQVVAEPGYTVNEMTPLSFQVSVSDPNNDPIALQTPIPGMPEGAAFEETGAPGVFAFTWTPTYVQAGSYTCTFAFTDDDGLSGSADVIITVLNVNRPPEAENQEVAVHENVPTPITLTASDPDGDPLTYTVVSDPLHGTLSGTPPSLTYTPTEGYRGDDSFEFQADDSQGEIAAATVSLAIFANQPPAITSMPLTAAGVDFEYAYPVTALDPDEDPLSYSLLAAPDGMILRDGHVISWTPTEEQISGVQVSVQVTDGYGGSDTQAYWIRVSDSNSAANTAPIAQAGDDYTLEEGARDILDGSHSFDDDGDHLFYHWTQTAGPEVELDSRFARQPGFTAPEVEANTLLTFELMVNDGTTDSQADEVNVMVLNMDLPPEGNGIVTNSNPDGSGSLKAAIEYANANPGTRITFNIPDTDPKYDAARGVWQLGNPIMGSTYGGATGIYLHSDGWILDGYSQTENQGDRNPFGPEIEIDRSISGGAAGFSGNNVLIRGLAFTQGSNEKGVVMLCPGKRMVLEGNYIGVDATGTTLMAEYGLVMATHPCAEWGVCPDQDEPKPDWKVRVGGSRPGQGNLLSGNIRAIGIGGHVGPASVTIQGNLVGLDRTGTIPLGSQTSGNIRCDQSMTNLQIGGVTTGSRNVIRGGILVYMGGDNDIVIQNNYIGTDITGSVAVNPYSGNGIMIGYTIPEDPPAFPASLLIGGSIPGAGNVISGLSYGINNMTRYDQVDFDLTIQGNFIGTDATGTQIIGNHRGISNNGTSRHRGRIGGTGPNEGNVIGGNDWGIHVSLYDRYTIQGNKIGVGSDGVTPVPNGIGISVNGFNYSYAGGWQEGAGNSIAFNGTGIQKWEWDNGYHACGSTLRYLGNQIHDNTGYGIGGFNITRQVEHIWEGTQNYPVISHTEAGNGTTHVIGNLDSSNPQNCMVEIFANHACDASGYGEGKRWVSAVYPEADGSFETTIPENLSGFYLTATATRMIRVETDPRWNSSGFSPCRRVGDFAVTNEPPVITSDPVVTAIAETPYEYQVLANDPEGGSLTYVLALAPEGMTIDENGRVAWTPSLDQEGYRTVTVVVRDAQGLYAAQNFRMQILPLVDTEPPVVSIVIPADLTVDTNYDIIGTITDPYLVWYGIEIAPSGSGKYRLIGEGTASILSDVVGAIDPAILANGLYDGRVTAYDQDGHLTVFNLPSPIEISSKLKIGQFSFAFQDIAIPVAGIPITVTRTYNSFDKEKGDFGVGWDMAMMSGVKIQTTRTLGTGWQAVPSGSFLGSTTYDLMTDTVPKVLVTYADGSQDRFTFTPDFVTQPAIAPDWVRPAFTALEGTTATLEVVAASDLLLDAGQLQDYSATEIGPFDPDRYRLTTAEGMVFIISQSQGLQSITDPNGNTVTFTPDGIAHGSGLSIDMTRDTEGRITRITDPMGHDVTYAYDENGDLISFTDRESNLTQFGYDDDHNLISIIDPRGIEVLKTEYDALGCMIGTVDGLGHATSINHDRENAVEYITDRNGHTTAYEYDTDGNIISETDPLGNTWSYGYDASGNKTSETDPLGNTKSWTYDNRNNLLTETDALGHTTERTYNSRNKVLTVTDPLGNVTTYTYDTKGNMETQTDALGNIVTYAYDEATGNLLSQTDCENNVITYVYDDYGNRISETDPLGNITTYTYDSNGNKLTETDALGNTTRMTYDTNGNLIRTIDSLGNETTTEFNDIGKKIAEVDKRGNRTTYAYDANGNLIRTIYPDGTEETITYDRNGNRITSTDKGGRTTQYVYSAAKNANEENANLNRLSSIVYPDGTSSSFEYDGIGNITATVDAIGNRMETEYDSVGRKIRAIDALNNVTTFSYDANGNQTSMTDANNHTTSYEYDALNRRVETFFADGTFSTVEYAASCCTGCKNKKLSETDPAGNTTLFEYDALDRLSKVIDPIGGESTYTYDAVGNKLTQTDANNHTTSFTYDSLRRVVTRTLPMGQSESFTYDANGNVITKTDFKGDTITYTYDILNRLTRKQYADSSDVSYTYTSSGKRETAIDARGVTAYNYDLRDRLLSVVQPDGTAIDYTYDAKGNRASVTVPSGTTAYTFDVLNRLQTVTDPNGGVTTCTYDKVGNRASITYPNGTVAEYVYSDLNRLTYIENRRSAVGEVISSYRYTLGPAGNRLSVIENSGREVNYSYDDLYRLTQEQITDSELGNQTIAYTYDAVGNRLTKTDGFGTITYTYNANDQLMAESAPSTTNTYTYDPNGNAISKSDGTETTQYDYDFENRMISAQTNSGTTNYTYDMDGIRVASDTDGDITDYLVDKNRRFAQVIEERDGAGALVVSYVYGDDLISQHRNGVGSYYLYDGQMSTRRLSDALASVTDSYVYDAFGILINHTGASENNYLYTGEQYDPNAGFYYLRARYYNQETGRFMVHDPLLGRLFSPDTLHRYLYANANPIMFIDPSGKVTIAQVMATVAIILIAALINKDVQGRYRGYINIGNMKAYTDAFQIKKLYSYSAGVGPFLATEQYVICEQPTFSRPKTNCAQYIVHKIGVGVGIGYINSPGDWTYFKDNKRSVITFSGTGGELILSVTFSWCKCAFGKIMIPGGTDIPVPFRCELNDSSGLTDFQLGVDSVWSLWRFQKTLKYSAIH